MRTRSSRGPGGRSRRQDVTAQYGIQYGRGVERRVGARRRDLGPARRQFHRIHGPGEHEPVGADAPRERAPHVAVHVAGVFHDAGPEHVEVEMGIAGHERVVRPIDEVRTETGNGGELEFLEPAADADVLRLGAHGEHVRPVHHATVFHAGESEHESEQTPVAGKGPRRDAPHALRDLEHGGRRDVGEAAPPGVVLEIDRGAIVGERGEGADGDGRLIWHGGPVSGALG